MTPSGAVDSLILFLVIVNEIKREPEVIEGLRTIVCFCAFEVFPSIHLGFFLYITMHERFALHVLLISSLFIEVNNE